MSLSLVAAVGRNRELGKDGRLIWHLPEDLRYFRELTEDHPVIMGRKTFESLPGLLKNRKHYVVTRRGVTGGGDFGGVEEVEAVSDLPALLEKFKNSEEEAFVIGGAAVYQAALEECQKLYLTEIEAEDAAADVFFPEFKQENYERTVIKTGKDSQNDLAYSFVVYSKK